MRYYYIYMITNLLNNKQYVGSKMYDCEKPGIVYMGSSRNLNVDIELFGIENFNKIKLEENILFKTKEELLHQESYWVHVYDTINPNGYNCYDPEKQPGFCTVGTHLSKEHKDKLTVALTGKHRTKEQKQNMKKPHNYPAHKSASEEAKHNMSIAKKGNKNACKNKK